MKCFVLLFLDANLIHSLLGYKVSNDKLGFLIDSTTKVKEKLSLPINYIFCGEEMEERLFPNNQYFFYLKKVEEEKFYNQIVKSLIPIIREKIEVDFHNYEKIKRYLNEL